MTRMYARLQARLMTRVGDDRGEGPVGLLAAVAVVAAIGVALIAKGADIGTAIGTAITTAVGTIK